MTLSTFLDCDRVEIRQSVEFADFMECSGVGEPGKKSKVYMNIDEDS